MQPKNEGFSCSCSSTQQKMFLAKLSRYASIWCLWHPLSLDFIRKLDPRRHGGAVSVRTVSQLLPTVLKRAREAN